MHDPVEIDKLASDIRKLKLQIKAIADFLNVTLDTVPKKEEHIVCNKRLFPKFGG